MKAHPIRTVFAMMVIVLLFMTGAALAQSVGSASSVNPVPIEQAPSLWVLPVINFPFVVSPASGMTLSLDNQLLLGWVPWAWATPYAPPTHLFMSLGIPDNYDNSVGSANTH